MKANTLWTGLLTIFIFYSCQENQPGGSSVELNTKLDTVSYIMGLNFGRNIKRNGMGEVNYEALNQAIKDILSDSETKIETQKASIILSTYVKQLRNEKWVKHLEEGKNFLAENGAKEGVITTESGLQYTILKQGDGPKPTAGDRVSTHYHGTLLNGTVFDSSVERGEPISFAVNGVISGWTEALQLMPVGSKWKLFLPSKLAYGARGSRPKIPPHSTLIFEVELLGIEGQ